MMRGAVYSSSNACNVLVTRGDKAIVFDYRSSCSAHGVKWGPLVVGCVIGLLRAMGLIRVKPLVCSSTCAVYGDPKIVSTMGAETCKPVSGYGRTKRAVEQILCEVARIGMHYATLRYLIAAGASSDAEFGEELDPETHLIPKALKSVAGSVAR